VKSGDSISHSYSCVKLDPHLSYMFRRSADDDLDRSCPVLKRRRDLDTRFHIASTTTQCDIVSRARGFDITITLPMMLLSRIDGCTQTHGRIQMDYVCREQDDPSVRVLYLSPNVRISYCSAYIHVLFQSQFYFAFRCN